MRNVREAEKRDLDALLSLYLFLHEDRIPNRDGPVQAAWMRIMDDPNHHVIVSEENGRIVSSCICVIVPNLTHDVRPYALVENVVTHPGFRGRGHASRCLGRAREIAEENGCYKIMLMTGSQQEATHRFYRNAGYNSADKTAYIQWLNDQ